MHPILIKFGPFTVFSYGFMLALGFLLALGVAERRSRRSGLDPAAVQTLALVCLIAGLVGGRLAYILLNLPIYTAQPLEVIRLDHGGLVFYGGLIFGILAGLLFVRIKRLPAWTTLDVMIPALVLAHAVGRVGCFLNGCCYGTASTLPWAVLFPGDAVRRHPVQLYEAAALLGIYFILRAVEKGRFRPGSLLFVYGLLYGIWRFFAEFLRADNPRAAAGLTVFQWSSLVLIAVSALLLIARVPRGSSASSS